MKRRQKTSFNDPCHAHFLTFSCFRRCQLFTDDSACRLMADSIERARRHHNFELWAYVFMPDHMHLLLRPRHADYSIPQILRQVAHSSAVGTLYPT
ncbi:MAG: transposase [Candidatus Zixiibacteriota bacterium]